MNINHRRRQHDSKKVERKRVIEWMVNTCAKSGTDNNIAARAVDNPDFRLIFQGSDCPSRKANRTKAQRWYDSRQEFFNKLDTPEDRAFCVTSTKIDGVGQKRFYLKSMAVRERKRLPWVNYKHKFMIEEFKRLSSLGMRMTRPILLYVATAAVSHEASPVTLSSLDDHSGRPIAELLNRSFIERFCARYDIVRRKQSGCLSRSAAHLSLTERKVANYLGNLHLAFRDNVLDENMVENMDETHFLYDMDTHVTLSHRGYLKPTYGDVVSGGEGFTLVLRITGGPNARLQAPFFIFRNRNRNYPIGGCPDNIPGVSYRTQPSVWMDRKCFSQWLEEKRAIAADSDGRTRFLYCQNCTGHDLVPDTQDSLQRINTVLHKLPANATHLCQLLDSFVIQKFKSLWRNKWNNELKRSVLIGEHRDGSGKLSHPSRHWYMHLAVECTEKLRCLVDSDVISYPRKAIIRCGLSCDIDGTWRKKQLFQHLQDIIYKYPVNFNGAMPTINGDIEMETESDSEYIYE